MDRQIGEFKNKWEYYRFRTQYLTWDYIDKCRLSMHYKIIREHNSGKYLPLIDAMWKIWEYRESIKGQGLWFQLSNGTRVVYSSGIGYGSGATGQANVTPANNNKVYGKRI